VANRCEPTGGMQRVAAGFVIAFQRGELALAKCTHLRNAANFRHLDVVTVTTFVTGAQLDAANRQKAAGLLRTLWQVACHSSLDTLEGVRRRLRALRRLSEGARFTRPAL
jgi:sigma54-dependent transcription regulator